MREGAGALSAEAVRLKAAAEAERSVRSFLEQQDLQELMQQRQCAPFFPLFVALCVLCVALYQCGLYFYPRTLSLCIAQVYTPKWKLRMVPRPFMCV